MKMKTILGSVVATLGVALSVPAIAFAATTVVNSTEDAGWTRQAPAADNRGTATMEISNSFGAPSGFGSSSLVIKTLTGADKAQLANPLETSVLLSSIDQLSYNTFRDGKSTSNPKSQLPALNLVIDFNGEATEGGFATLVYEPVYQKGGAASIKENQWQSWDGTGDAIWWSTRPMPGVATRDTTYVSLDSIIANNRQAVVQNVIINQGTGNAGLTAAVDGLNFNGNVFNFELKPERATDKEDCKKEGWKTNFITTYKNQGDCVSSVTSQMNKSDTNKTVLFKIKEALSLE
ncbi:hypothetical protein H7Y63_00865 [Polaromonas sp.]|nr:hypothetical protein [Candidatus Saccharibacteria bacterium]